MFFLAQSTTRDYIRAISGVIPFPLRTNMIMAIMTTVVIIITIIMFLLIMVITITMIMVIMRQMEHTLIWV